MHCHRNFWDADGNLLSDGQRNYSWDAENRLIGITYAGVSGKATAFAYDGLNRRTAISSTPAGGGSALTTSYLWCGRRICQARDASNAVTRSYYAEGEYLPGATPQSLYYGQDQIGSVRRVFASTTSAPAFTYDPYGNALQATAPVTDFNYAGMFYSADSGLYLTQYRAYDPVAGRWLSRDPLGEITDPAGNLYAYAGGNPVIYTDPSGQRIGGNAWGALAGALAGLGLEYWYNGDCASLSDYARAALIGALAGAGLGQAGEALGLFGNAGAEGAGAGEVAASTPVGRSGNPIEVKPGTNQPGTIAGRDYSGHALDRMQGRGIPPSAVEDAIQNGVAEPGNLPGRTAYYSSENNLTVVTDSSTGRVITVRQGPP